jgi:Right handed beta helix region
MLRRDVATALIATTAAVAALPKPTRTQSGTPPCYPQTASEISLGITPTNTDFPPHSVDRYGANITPGTTDMWQAITHANSVASHDGAAVIFQAGEVYGVNITNTSAHPNTALHATTHWVCSGPAATVRRIDYLTTRASYTVQCISQVNLVFFGLVFDGQVTALSMAVNPSQGPNVDIGPVGSFRDNGNEDLWSQTYGVNFAYTQNCTIENCRFQNFLRAGLRIDCKKGAAVASGPPWAATISLGNRVVNCKFIRNRGVYGDGFYAEEQENLFIAGCYAYDYQRIGFVFEINGSSEYIGSNGVLISGCVADYGHDAAISAAQSNAGFWLESGDSYELVNCESKNTAIGFVSNFAGGAATGVYRPWTGTHALKGCKAIRCRQQGFRLEYGSADAHVVLDNCFAEVNRNAASSATCVGGAPAGVEISYTPGTNTIIAGRFELKGCCLDMVGCSTLTQCAGIGIRAGAVARFCQMTVDIRDSSFRWIASGKTRATDTAVQTRYESTSSSNYGYFGDIVFSGLNDQSSDLRFKGSATISNCVNHSFGYLLFDSETVGSNSVFTIENCNISMRTGGNTSNGPGTLRLTGCNVDTRGQLGWGLVCALGCTFLDWNPAHPDRTAWQATEFKLSNCLFTRQLRIAMNGSPLSSTRPLRLTANGVEWYLNFATEPGLRLVISGGSYGAVNMSGCTFRNNGNHSSSSNAMIMCDTTTGLIQFAGAGNTFDATFVTGGGGHCVEYSTGGPNYNDTPQTVGTPFVTAFGVQQTFAPY